MDELCEHGGYLLQDGVLVCASCGAPSESEKWQANVFGFETQGSQHRHYWRVDNMCKCGESRETELAGASA